MTGVAFLCRVRSEVSRLGLSGEEKAMELVVASGLKMKWCCGEQSIGALSNSPYQRPGTCKLHYHPSHRRVRMEPQSPKTLSNQYCVKHQDFMNNITSVLGVKCTPVPKPETGTPDDDIIETPHHRG
jgi:hypothetical protein